jgi:uncharacterized RDD family membrane protein YckC
MYCPFCGRSSSKGWVFCSDCGRRMPTELSQSAQPGTGSALATDALITSAEQPHSRLLIGRPDAVWLDGPIPWRRYFARMLDIMGWGFLLGIALGLAGFDSGRTSKITISILCVALWVPAESILLATFGSTPGKWMLALKVKPSNRTNIGFDTAIKRSAHVWIRGLWLGLPIVALGGLVNSYSTLTTTGTTTWDERCSTAVLHTRIDMKRIAVLAGLGLISLIILLLGTSASE